MVSPFKDMDSSKKIFGLEEEVAVVDNTCLLM